MKKLILILLLILLLTACSQINYVEINNIKIPVELAATEQQKAQGLMFRTNLTGGMLFSYEDEQMQQFWMKNTLIPLDIIFIGKNNKITAIHYALPCKNDPCEIYSGNAKYILELNGNFAAKNGIKEGAVVNFLR